MKTKSSKLFLIIFGSFLFNAFFWEEKMGINVLLFDIFICASVFKLFPFAWRNNAAKLLFAGHVITVAMVLVQNTLLSKIAFSISLLLFISFSQYIHRSALYASGSIVLNYLHFIPNFIREFRSEDGRKVNIGGWPRSIRMLIIPIAILLVFVAIYSFGNAIFSAIASSIADKLINWFTHFFDWFPFERFWFFSIGIFIVGGLMLRSRNSYFSDLDMECSNDLSRKKNRLQKWKESSFADLLEVIIGKTTTGIMALKSEYKIGALSLVLLNLLLLFINILDVKYVWLGYRVKDTGLSAYVHEGAGLLIVSIVFAMLLLLIFFRGNLSFYKKNIWLKTGAYIWIIQNFFLVLSVFIRDYYYISHLGLAYKRIGLLFFLTMVSAGLITVFIKIYFTKTTYYLLRINAWVAIILLVIASLVPWDETIAEYNLARKSTIPVDVPFLLSLSNKTLPLLQQNKEVLEKSTAEWFYYRDNYYKNNALSFFEYRKKQFIEEQKNYTWLSWNIADEIVKNKLALKFSASILK